MSVDLQQLHTFQLPAKASALFRLSSLAQLPDLAKLDNVIILAGGSNTLFIDDYQGTVVVPDFTGIEESETATDYKLRVGAAENWHQLVNYCLTKNMNGLENLALIPGTVGAAPVQNIGAYGIEVGTFIDSVEVVDINAAKQQRFSAKDCQFAYRDSLFKQNPGRYLITHVNFNIPKQWQPVLSYGPLQSLIGKEVNARAVYDKVIEVRQSKLPDPEITPNAGSFFKNPVVSKQHLQQILENHPDVVYFQHGNDVKLAAGWMIDRVGLKGLEINGAAVHQQQALVLVNKGTATADAVIRLCRKIVHEVFHAFAVRLEPEVRLIGRAGLLSPPELESLLYE